MGTAKRAALSARSDSRARSERTRDRLYAWWWWRGPNRPHLDDTRYLDELSRIPEGALGLDLGSRARIRPDAITLDVEAVEGVDVVGDGHALPFADDTFDYIWCNAVLEHVRDPRVVASEITRTLRPGGVAIVQVPFLEFVHSWPADYYRFTQNGLREIFGSLDEVAVGVSAGPSQVLPDLIQYYAVGFAELQKGRLLTNLLTVAVGIWLLPLRALDRVFRRRPSYWKWARAYYFVGRKPGIWHEGRLRALFVTPEPTGEGFEEIMRVRTTEMIEALAAMGSTVLPLPARKVAEAERGEGDHPRVQADLVVAPNMNYYLLAARSGHLSRVAKGSVIALLWDDPLGALALTLADERRATMGHPGGDVEGDVLDRWRHMTRAPEVRHFAWDSGHVRTMERLGLVDPSAVTWYPIATFDAFLRQGTAPAPEPVRDLAFCGNVYPASASRSAFSDEPVTRELVARIVERKTADLSLGVWELLDEAVGRVPQSQREQLGLVPERAPFWDFYVYVAWMALNTEVRLAGLTALDRQVELFGMFADPDSVALLADHPNLVYRGNAHQFRELPRVFAETRVNVCLSNTLIDSGVPSKFVDCVASGGFALVDDKSDLRRLFGPEIDQVTFRNIEELREKVAYFLARPAERRELVSMLRETIARECTLERLFERIVDVSGR